VVHGISKDSSDLSDWTLYQKINFHYHSIDEVLLTLLKYSSDKKTLQTYESFKVSFSDIEKKPLDRYCARSIASQTKIMAGASLALAGHGVSDAAQDAELEKMSKAIGDPPESLDDHDALMARVTADCLLRIVVRNIRSQGATQQATALRNQIASAGENNGPVKAAELAYNTMAQVMMLGLESSGEQAKLSKAREMITSRDERLPSAADAFSRLEICLDTTSQILMLYAGSLTR
jgi:hypothetical protein